MAGVLDLSQTLKDLRTVYEKTKVIQCDLPQKSEISFSALQITLFSFFFFLFSF